MSEFFATLKMIKKFIQYVDSRIGNIQSKKRIDKFLMNLKRYYIILYYI